MIVMVKRWRKNKMVVMGVDVCMLDRALASPIAPSSAMISKKMAKTLFPDALVSLIKILAVYK
jgi:hypothetical protein